MHTHARRNQEFCRLHREGMSYSKIAWKCNVSRGAVAGAIYRTTKLDAVRAYHIGRGEMVSPEKAAERRAERRRLVAIAVPLTERDKKIADLYGAGLTLRAIGEQTGIHWKTVQRLLRMSLKRGGVETLNLSALSRCRSTLDQVA